MRLLCFSTVGVAGFEKYLYAIDTLSNKKDYDFKNSI